MKTMIFDCETTGFDAPEIIEAGWIGMPDDLGALRELPLWQAIKPEGFERRYKPSKPISFGAMATHHIVDSDLVECESAMNFRLPIDLEYMIGHGVDYDWRVVGSPEDIKRIDTLAICRYLWPDTDSHRLAAMAYFLFGDEVRKICMSAHSALVDCRLTLAVLTRALAERKDIMSWEGLYEFSEEARVPRRFTFGKHGPKNGQKGMEIAQVRHADPGYYSWLLSGKCDQVNEDPYLKKALLAAPGRQ